MAALAPRTITGPRLARLDELVQADALPALGWHLVGLPDHHPLRFDLGAGRRIVPVVRIDASTRPDVAQLARTLRGARPRGSSRLRWLEGDPMTGRRSHGGGRLVLVACVLGRPRVRLRAVVAPPDALDLLRAIARAGVVLVDPCGPDDPPDVLPRPTIALAPTADLRAAAALLEAA